MKNPINRRALLTGFLAALFLPGSARGQNAVNFPKSQLAIDTNEGRKIFDVELAISDAQQSRGLMFRETMAADAGMLFDYRFAQRITMWMRNTLIPLDMIFIGADGRVINVAERTIPHSEAIIASKGRARAVLEVNGGTASRLGIKAGTKVYHRIFGTGP
ncbi:MAG: DUF192 domain-containing protein [Rhodospirillaceae bacterium]|nr:DUF192 domain-containing protein [Rhodospirillaceae bacterium]MBT4672565.1 DUF192 domain-containing protein [Rhodospirillaceae bacterium]